jgi:hypothetical protein
MRDRIPTRHVTEGVDQHGGPAQIEVVVRNDGRVTLASSTPADELVFFNAEQVARLRNQLGDALTVALRDTQTTRCSTP